MTTEQKLKEIEEFVNTIHEQVSLNLEEADNRENDGDVFDEDEIIDIEKWDAVVNITSQLKDILNK